MTDLEISKALALALGWRPEQMRANADGVLMLQATDFHFARPFSYRDWNVISPIAAKFNCFPTQYNHLNMQWLSCAVMNDSYAAVADTPQKAIALAVITGAKK